MSVTQRRPIKVAHAPEPEPVEDAQRNIAGKVFDAFDGKKTYIVAIALGVVATLEALGYINSATADWLRTFLLGTGLATMYGGVKGAVNKAK